MRFPLKMYGNLRDFLPCLPLRGSFAYKTIKPIVKNNTYEQSPVIIDNAQ